ncbi:MAG: hypothetical protein GF331_00105 [Chitinivibrionales bacterium]|nr:hypothetical protein [Chitinivibrionales bacterium]
MGKTLRWILIATTVIVAVAAAFALAVYLRRASVAEPGTGTDTIPSAEQVARRSGTMETAQQEELTR